MSSTNNNLINKVVAVVITVAIAGGLVSWGVVANSPGHKLSVIVDSANQITEVSYKGQQGKNAFVLLEQHAKVGAKHYSFGDLVISINGVVGNGPKYWTFYVNGNEAAVGASDYQTKNGDTLSWKLQ